MSAPETAEEFLARNKAPEPLTAAQREAAARLLRADDKRPARKAAS